MDGRLLEILVRSLYKGTLQHDRASNELACHVDKLAYPIHGDTPVMLADETRQTVKGAPADSA